MNDAVKHRFDKDVSKPQIQLNDSERDKGRMKL